MGPDSKQGEIVNADGAEIENRVTFFPPLQDCRRGWILRKLREENVTSVLDIGCGEGSLLSCLCNAPVFLPNPAITEEQKQEWSSAWALDINLTRIAGLDISRRELEECARATEPGEEGPNSCLPRWEPLDVELWHGSLDVANEGTLEAYECIVSTEVIEHLPPPILTAFAPTLLGIYTPRLLLLTTPNFTFNARFTPPGVIDPHGYPDPTNRTDRVFRHSDHKFEWTVDEFRTWCEDAARQWGYEVAVDGIGKPKEVDPWGRDEELGYATQVAAFRRIDSEVVAQQRKRSVEAYKTGQNTRLQPVTSHELFKKHFHAPHAAAGKPAAVADVQAAVIKFMSGYYTECGYDIWDLWVCNDVSVACGGYLDVLMTALASSPELCIERSGSSLESDDAQTKETESKGNKLPVLKWSVKFRGEKHLEAIERTAKLNPWLQKIEETSNDEGYRSDGTEGGGELPGDGAAEDDKSMTGSKPGTSLWHNPREDQSNETSFSCEDACSSSKSQGWGSNSASCGWGALNGTDVTGWDSSWTCGHGTS